MKLPFGIHQDKHLEEIPDGYLQYLLDNGYKGPYHSFIVGELKRRKNPGAGTTTKLSKSVFMEELAILIQKVPDEFLSNEYKLKTPTGEFSIRIRRNGSTT